MSIHERSTLHLNYAVWIIAKYRANIASLTDRRWATDELLKMSWQSNSASYYVFLSNGIKCHFNYGSDILKHFLATTGQLIMAPADES